MPHLWPDRDKLEWLERHGTAQEEEPADAPSFREWLPSTAPKSWRWDWLYQQYIREHLRSVTAGEIDRLMLFLPPRHGKSSMVTVRYPAWRLEQDPELRVIIGAYSQTLANRFSRQTRKIARTRIELDTERTAAEEWETAAGGGLRAAGVGAGVTGMGGHVVIIDDPVKNREQANSQVYRDKVWDWYTDDLYTRLEPGAVIILIMTRWHEDDLAGRILASEDAASWTVVSLPALAEENDPLERNIGAALCPQRYDVEALARIKTVLGNSFYALYQQRPQAPEGDFFKRQWFEVLPAAPAEFDALVRYWDKASSLGGDFTAGVLMGRRGGLYYVLDVVRGQWVGADREKVIRQTAETDRVTWGHVRIGVEQEGGSGGKDSAAATVRNLAGFSVYTEHPTGDKATRAEPYQAQCMAGNVKLIAGAWVPAYLTELTSFPTGTNDDQVDGSSGSFNKLAGRRSILIGVI